MPDRFDNAQWYIGWSGGSATIWDSSDADGTGPSGHGMVCRGAVMEDAALIAQAPALFHLAKLLVASWECGEHEDAQYESLLDEAIDQAKVAIDMVEKKGE